MFFKRRAHSFDYLFHRGNREHSNCKCNLLQQYPSSRFAITMLPSLDRHLLLHISAAAYSRAASGNHLRFCGCGTQVRHVDALLLPPPYPHLPHSPESTEQFIEDDRLVHAAAASCAACKNSCNQIA